VADVIEITVVGMEITLSCVRCDGDVSAALASSWVIAAKCGGCGAAMMFSASVPSFVDRDAPWRS
jgi:hypothetical protein